MGDEHARNSDPDTSQWASAELSQARAEAMCKRLLRAFARARRGLTAEMACTLCGYSASDGGWKRVSDLQRWGMVEDTGLRVIGTHGRRVRVLRITDKGRETAA